MLERSYFQDSFSHHILCIANPQVEDSAFAQVRSSNPGIASAEKMALQVHDGVEGLRTPLFG